MSDAAITTFIDIQARNTASAEFRKVAIEGKKAAAEVGGGFKGLASQGIGDAVNEIKSFARAFGLIWVARKLIVPLIEDWVKVQKETAAARKELDFYLMLRGAGAQVTGALKALATELSETTSNTFEASAAMVALGDRFGLSLDQTRKLAQQAAVLGKEFSAYKGDPVKAFDDLARAEQGFSEQLEKNTNLDLSTGEARLALTKQLLAAMKEARAESLEQGIRNLVPGFINPGGLARDKQAIIDLREEAAILRREAGTIGALDPLDKDRDERDQEQAREDAKAMRADNREAAQEAKANARDLREEMHVLAMAGQDMGDAFGGAFAGLITGAMTAKEAFRAFVSDMVRMIARLIAEFIALAIARAIAGAGSFGSIAAGASAGGNGANLPTPGIGGGGGAGLGGMPPGGPRSLPGSLGAGMGGGGGDTINIYAIDAKSFQQRLTEEQGHLGKLSMDSNRRSSTFRRAFGSQGRVR